MKNHRRTTTEPAKDASPVNHRTIVGRRRRARTEAKIIASAIHVFAEKGEQNAVIDDFIEAAGIARGTFYNYFRSTNELLTAAKEWLSDDLHETITESMRDIEDPLIRLGMGIRLWMRKAATDRAWCGFVAQVRLMDTRAAALPIRDLKQSRKAGLLSVPSLEVAVDLMEGMGIAAMHRMLKDPDLKNYENHAVIVTLQGLGASAARIADIMKRPLPPFRRPPRTVE